MWNIEYSGVTGEKQQVEDGKWKIAELQAEYRMWNIEYSRITSGR
jgi:hypothetical protein